MDQPKKNKKLFEDFPPIATDDWEKIIKKDLKGLDYNDKLVWNTDDGFPVRPYYRSGDLDHLGYLNTLPGDFPFVRGNKVNSNDWFIRQDILINNIGAANEKALNVLKRGVNSLGLILERDHDYSRKEIDQLLRNIVSDAIELNFISHPGQALKVIEVFKELAIHYNRDLGKICGSIDFDPLGSLTLKGEFYKSQDESFAICKKLIEISQDMPFFTVLSVYGSDFKDEGSSIVDELAFSLAMGAEFLTRLTDDGLSVDEIAPNIKFNFGVGSNYFMEIAKIRAARLLWANIVNVYGPDKQQSCRMNIHAITTDWNMTLYDPHVNMIRSTTEAMSAIIGNCDSLTVKPFNSIYEEPTEFSERIARNQQLLLKEESYFDRVIDPSAGSYYVENLTDNIAREAWDLFLQIDQKGGYIEAFKSGFIQKKIKKTSKKKDHAISTRKEILLGTNQYPDFDEHINKKIDNAVLMPRDRSCEDSLVDTVKTYRGAQAFERLRYRTDQYSLKNVRPKAFMLLYGNLAMRIARSRFSRNFFACAGYEVIYNPGVKSIEDGIQSAIDHEADIVVLCSSDAGYDKINAEIYSKLKDKAIIVIAGYPEERMEKLKKIGIKYFIHSRSDVLAELQNFQKELGIK